MENKDLPYASCYIGDDGGCHRCGSGGETLDRRDVILDTVAEKRAVGEDLQNGGFRTGWGLFMFTIISI